MTWYIDATQLQNNRNLQRQHEDVVGLRAIHHENEQRVMGLAPVNMRNAHAQIPLEVYRQFDADTRQLFLPEGGIAGDGLLTDLLALGRSVHIGQLVSGYRRAGGLAGGQSSIDGQHSKPVDQVAYDYEQDLVPIHDKVVGRKWRELEAMRSGNFDALVDDVAAGTRVVRETILNALLDGLPNLNYQGASAYGIKTNPNTNVVTLTVNLASAATTFQQAEQEIIRILRILHDDNNQVGDVTIYVSSAVWYNWLRTDTNDTRFSTWLEAFQRIPGVGAIKRSTKLSGGEVVAMIPRQDVISPIVGQAVNAVPIARPTPYADFNVWIWSAVGLRVTADYEGNSGVLYGAPN